jgi:cobalt/nickel transport system ATP-binding protein
VNDRAFAIEVAGLSFDYHGSPAIKDVSFAVAPGERVGFVGANGAGKSTLLLHLNGLLTGRGSVRIDGMEVVKKNLGRIRRRVGLVFPDPEDQLFMPTLEEDVAFGPLNMGDTGDVALKKAHQALGRMGLADLANRSSHHLSDGERRRAAIASVLSMQPSIWVMDEPAANLDPRGRRELVKIMKDLPGTIVLASHDLDLVVQVCERCLVLASGQIVADGETRKLLMDAELMERNGLEVPLRLQIGSGDHNQ